VDSPECENEKPENRQSPAQQAKTSKLAIASLVLALLALISIISAFILRYDIAVHICLLAFYICPPVALILGIISIFKIRKSKGQLKGKVYAIVGIVIPSLFATYVIYAATRPTRCVAIRMLCGTRIKSLGSAIMVYSADNDDKYPTADKWCDLLMTGGYALPEYFVCDKSDAKIGESSYAFNKNLVGKDILEIPPDVVLLFETKGGWNQVGGPELLTVDNHDGEGCNILFNDFSVRFVTTSGLGRLKWTVEESETPTQKDANNIE